MFWGQSEEAAKTKDCMKRLKNNTVCRIVFFGSFIFSSNSSGWFLLRDAAEAYC
jgi:hypothetical protein